MSQGKTAGRSASVRPPRSPNWLLHSAVLVPLLLTGLVARGAAEPPSSLPIPSMPAAITGSTIDIFGQLLEGVEVRIHATDPETGRLTLHTVQSDRKGRFQIRDLPPGDYRVLAVKGGYAVLVGQVNTLFERSLELILRPAGREGAPGAVPESSSWALRLPGRDPLEDLGAGIAEQLESVRETEPGLGLPLTLELTASQRQQDGTNNGDTASGMTAEIGTTFSLGSSGYLGMSFRHRNEGDQEQSLDRSDRLQALYVPHPGAGGFPVSVRLDAVRDRRERTGMSSPLRVAAEGARLHARWSGQGADGVISAELDASMLRGMQLVGEPVLNVGRDDGDQRGSQVELRVSGQRAWGDENRTTYRATVRAVSGGLHDATAEELQLALVPLVARIEEVLLDALASSSADFGVENRWFAERLRGELTTSFRMEHVSGLQDDLRASASMGGRWALPAGLVLGADGGFGVQSTGEVVPIWSAAVGGGNAVFNWNVTRSRETGIAPWRMARQEAGTMISPLITDRDGDVVRWSGVASWQQRSHWPEVRVRGEAFEIEGRLAAYLSGDLPWVPIDSNGSGSGQSYDLLIDNATTGTHVGVGFTTVEDRGDRLVLLSGARAWRMRQLNVRQRLGSREWGGATWQLILGVEQGKVMDEAAGASSDARLALLEQRRVSGGLALAF